jgi:hypothetical protein
MNSSVGSIKKGMILCKTIILNAQKYYSCSWKPKPFAEALIADSGLDKSEFNHHVINIVAEEMGIAITRNTRRIRVNDNSEAVQGNVPQARPNLQSQ